MLPLTKYYTWMNHIDIFAEVTGHYGSFLSCKSNVTFATGTYQCRQSQFALNKIYMLHKKNSIYIQQILNTIK